MRAILGVTDSSVLLEVVRAATAKGAATAILEYVEASEQARKAAEELSSRQIAMAKEVKEMEERTTRATLQIARANAETDEANSKRRLLAESEAKAIQAHNARLAEIEDLNKALARREAQVAGREERVKAAEESVRGNLMQFAEDRADLDRRIALVKSAGS